MLSKDIIDTIENVVKLSNSRKELMETRYIIARTLGRLECINPKDPIINHPMEVALPSMPSIQLKCTPDILRTLLSSVDEDLEVIEKELKLYIKVPDQLDANVVKVGTIDLSKGYKDACDSFGIDPTKEGGI
jgi:hypothetical protein